MAPMDCSQKMMTATQESQFEMEAELSQIFSGKEQPLFRNEHAAFISKMEAGLNDKFVSLDATRPFLTFWLVNGLQMLGIERPEDDVRLADTLFSCYVPEHGVFAGGSGQTGHLIPTYGALQALSYVKNVKVYDKIDTRKTLAFLRSLKQPNGSFKVCKYGEADIRGTYAAMAVAYMLNILTDDLVANVPEYVRSCQSYEGGFANEPGSEAHGGYAFCSLAALFIALGHKGIPNDFSAQIHSVIDVNALLQWLSLSQDSRCLGFKGRINKLVDSCYSFWVGACWPMLDQVVRSNEPLWRYTVAAQYILEACQHKSGGFGDHPNARPDAYHTNYSLCGLAVTDYDYHMGSTLLEWTPVERVERGSALNPVFGAKIDAIARIRTHFQQRTL